MSSFDNGYFTSSARSSTDNTSVMARCETISVDPRLVCVGIELVSPSVIELTIDWTKQAEIDNGDTDYSPSDLKSVTAGG
jgi:hypothetical protein